MMIFQVQRYQILVSLMLSSQTKDEVNNAAMAKLRKHGLNIQNILATSESTLRDLIYPVGFYKVVNLCYHIPANIYLYAYITFYY